MITQFQYPLGNNSSNKKSPIGLILLIIGVATISIGWYSVYQMSISTTNQKNIV